MTVSSETRRADYLGDGSTDDFATNFRFLQDQDLKVIVTVIATGVESKKFLTTDYTVSGAGLDAGGTVSMIVPPTAAEKISILRDVAITQETDYVENDPFPAESHERALDKLTMVVQQQQDDIDRSLKLQESQTSTGLTVPAPSVNLFLQWDADGNLKNTDIASLGNVAITDYGRTLVNTADSAAARVVLEAPKVAAPSAAGNISALLANGDNSDTGKSSDLIIPTADAAGTAQAITATYSPAVALADKTRVRLTALLSNTAAAPTFAPNGLAAHSIVKFGGQALVAGDIAGAGHELDLVYDLGNTRWELLNPSATEVLFSESFTSSEQAITSGGTLQLAHGLEKNGSPVEPFMCQFELVCQTAEGGYSVGDKVIINPATNNTGGVASRGISATYDTTNIDITYGSTSGVFSMISKDTGNAITFTNANWTLIAKAFA